MARQGGPPKPRRKRNGRRAACEVEASKLAALESRHLYEISMGMYTRTVVHSQEFIQQLLAVLVLAI